MELLLLTTPIGNISDASTRLKNCLSDEMLFFVEDSRQFYKLLDHLEIRNSDKSVHVLNDHKQDMVKKYVEMIKAEGRACVVSDAGSPVLSDPAYPLVKQLLNEGGEVVSVPGPSAVTMAIELCGLPPIPFSFYGFLPRQGNDLKELGSALKHEHTYCFFESPHRIVKTLSLWEKHFPHDEIFVGRELTKKFETHYRFKAGNFSQVKNDINVKGEFVVVVRPERSDTSISKDQKKLVKLADDYLDKKTPKKLAKLLSEILDRDVKDIYQNLGEK